MHNFITSIMLVAVLTFCGCKSGKSHSKESSSNKNEQRLNVSQGQKKSDVVAAYDRARASMLSEQQVYADVLWVLNQFISKDSELNAFVASAKNKVPDPTYVPGIFPDLPRIELPNDPGTGIKKFFTYVQAAFGEPEDRALLYLQSLIEEANTGYILTHQFLSLIWAEQTGLAITSEMLDRRQALWDKIYAEQRGVKEVDSIDLYMERVAIILLYGSLGELDKEIVDKWIATMLAMQLPDGSWPLSKTKIQYDQGSTTLSSPRSHTTALAMMALDAYLSIGW